MPCYGSYQDAECQYLDVSHRRHSSSRHPRGVGHVIADAIAIKQHEQEAKRVHVLPRSPSTSMMDKKKLGVLTQNASSLANEFKGVPDHSITIHTAHKCLSATFRCPPKNEKSLDFGQF